MSLILNLDTATSVCSVALARDEEILAQRMNNEGKNHAALLTTFIDQVLKETGTEPGSLDAVAVSKGPGSYTGLRIGVSTAKGMAYALSVPLLSAGTLEIMANGYLSVHPGITMEEKTLLCPMIDARRMEVYSAFFDTRLNPVREVLADIVDEKSYRELLNNHRILFFGDGAEKCRKMLRHDHALIDSSYNLSASHMVKLTLEKFRHGRFENVAYFEPFYLKDFVAIVPKNKIF